MIKLKSRVLNLRVHDVICDTDLSLDEINFVSCYKGERYYFCSKDCHNCFEVDPKKYSVNQPQNPVATF